MTETEKEGTQGMEPAIKVDGYFAPSDIKPMLEGMGVKMNDTRILLLLKAMEKYSMCLPWNQLGGFKDPSILDE